MPQRAANTPEEVWPKILKAILDLKIAANEQGDDGQMAKGVEIENLVFSKLREPIQQMLQAGQSDPNAMAQSLMAGMGDDPIAQMMSPSFVPPATPGLPGGGPQGLPPLPGGPVPGSVGGPGGAPDPSELARILP